MSINTPKKVTDRIIKTSKKYKRVLGKAIKADINESDTVLIIRDMLEEIFGYDRYNEITTEYAIRNTFCDVAVKVQDKLMFIIEVKAIGTDLNENHLRQAKEYSSSSGLDWVILTNGRIWKAYKLLYKKPVDVEQIYEIDWINENHRDGCFIEKVFCLCKEGLNKTALVQYQEEKQATNKYLLGAIILGEESIRGIRRNVKKITGINVGIDELKSVIKVECLKREVVEGDNAIAASRKYKTTRTRELKKKSDSCSEENS